MRFDELLWIVGDEPVFETSLLISGDVDPVDIRRQLSRWTANGRLLRLRRGLYSLPRPFRKVEAHPFVVANRLVRPSYVSLQSALAHHGVIPESVPVTTSVTTGRPGEFSTPLGDFVFRHVQVSLFRGFADAAVGRGQDAFVASAEKALLDLIYLEPGSDSQSYLDELRLDVDERLDINELTRCSRQFGPSRVQRAVARLQDRAADAARWESL